MAKRSEDGELREQIAQLEARVEHAEERRRALVHIMDDLNVSNRRGATSVSPSDVMPTEACEVSPSAFVAVTRAVKRPAA
jgi:hypothetical protein